MSLRERALAKASRKTRTVVTDEWGDVMVRELDAEQRLELMGGVDAVTQSLDFSLLLPYFADLVLDPETGKEAFEVADLDTIKRDHPGVLTRLLMAVVDLSELGDVDLAEAVGNSEAAPD